jgi:membrane protein implicated in regulation of membrane protease activity
MRIALAIALIVLGAAMFLPIVLILLVQGAHAIVASLSGLFLLAGAAVLGLASLAVGAGLLWLERRAKRGNGLSPGRRSNV